MRALSIGLVLGAALVLAACSSGASGPTEEPPDPGGVPVESMIPGTPTADPTSAPVDPTIVPMATTLNLEGPYVLFEGENGIWIANPDGSALTRLSDSGIGDADLHRAVSPQGEALAFITPSEHGPVLVRIDLPGGKKQVLATLQNVIPADVPIESLTPEAFAYFVITHSDNVAWAPDGGSLAFIGAMDGPTADLYLYDFEDGVVLRLTDGPSQAYYPTWSPDGEYILHFGGSFVPPFGGAIIGPTRDDGAWAVRAAGGSVIRQPEALAGLRNFVGWHATDRYLFSEDDDDCPQRDFRSFDPEGTEAQVLLAGCHSWSADLSPEDGALLFSSPACGECPLGEGTFLLRPGAPEPLRVWDTQTWEVRWLAEDGVFYAYPEGLVSGDGESRYDTPEPDYFEPTLSPDGWLGYVVVDESRDEIVIGRPGGELRPVLDVERATIIWSPSDGSTLLVAGDGELVALTAPEFAPRRVGAFDGDVSQAIWVR